jgi:hypothetical protein
LNDAGTTLKWAFRPLLLELGGDLGRRLHRQAVVEQDVHDVARLDAQRRPDELAIIGAQLDAASADADAFGIGVASVQPCLKHAVLRDDLRRVPERLLAVFRDVDVLVLAAGLVGAGGGSESGRQHQPDGRRPAAVAQDLGARLACHAPVVSPQ